MSEVSYGFPVDLLWKEWNHWPQGCHLPTLPTCKPEDSSSLFHRWDLVLEYSLRASSVLTSGTSHWFSGKRIHLQSRRHRIHGLDPWVGKMPWRRAWQPTPVFLPGESHGQRCWLTSVHKVTKSQSLLKQLGTHASWQLWFRMKYFILWTRIWTLNLRPHPAFCY